MSDTLYKTAKATVPNITEVKEKTGFSFPRMLSLAQSAS